MGRYIRTVLAFVFILAAPAAAGVRADAAGVRGPVHFGRNISQEYAVKLAGTLSLSFSVAVPVSINNQGQLVGSGTQCSFQQTKRGVKNDRGCGPPAGGRPSRQGSANPNFFVGGNCLFSDGATISDFTPLGVSECAPTSINEFGTVVGQAGGGGKIKHDISVGSFVYQSATMTFSSFGVNFFNQVNNLSIVAGGFFPGLTYDISSDTFTDLVNPQDDCEMAEAFGITDNNYIFGGDACTGPARFELVHNGQWHYLTPPMTILSGIPPNIHNDLLLVPCESTGCHTYLWEKAQGTPVDLGTLAGHSGDGYAALGFNNGRTVFGLDYTSSIYWVWDPIHHMRNLASLTQSNPYHAIVPSAINTAGDIACSALDSGGHIVWLVLVPPF